MRPEVDHVGDGTGAAKGGRTGEPLPSQNLGRAAFAGTIKPSVWDLLVADSEIVHVSAGKLIYRAGQPPPVVAILSGAARVFIPAAGGRQFTFRYAGQGR